MSFGPELVKGNIQTFIFAVLESGPSHGYALAKEIERRSEDALSFGEGTIYPALKGLERQGFIKGEWETPESGPARKMYRLTADGREELARRRDTWRRFARAVELTIGGKPNAEPA